MDVTQTANQPFKLDGTFNTRELGGYINKNSKKLNNHCLLRSDILSNLTSEDMDELYSYGIRTVVDLRRSKEIVTEPSKLRNYKDVEYFNVSLSTNDGGLMKERNIDSLSKLYQTYLLERQPQIKQIIELISDRLSRGGVIFNCTAGKDRTGIISLLLLKICDIENDIIAFDYAVSERNIRDYLNERIKEMNVEVPSFILGSQQIEIEKTLEFLEENFGTVNQYMAHIDVATDVLDNIRYHMIGEDK